MTHITASLTAAPSASNHVRFLLLALDPQAVHPCPIFSLPHFLSHESVLESVRLQVQAAPHLAPSEEFSYCGTFRASAEVFIPGRGRIVHFLCEVRLFVHPRDPTVFSLVTVNPAYNFRFALELSLLLPTIESRVSYYFLPMLVRSIFLFQGSDFLNSLQAARFSRRLVYRGRGRRQPLVHVQPMLDVLPQIPDQIAPMLDPPQAQPEVIDLEPEEAPLDLVIPPPETFQDNVQMNLENFVPVPVQFETVPLTIEIPDLSIHPIPMAVSLPSPNGVPLLSIPEPGPIQERLGSPQPSTSGLSRFSVGNYVVVEPQTSSSSDSGDSLISQLINVDGDVDMKVDVDMKIECNLDVENNSLSPTKSFKSIDTIQPECSPNCSLICNSDSSPFYSMHLSSPSVSVSSSDNSDYLNFRSPVLNGRKVPIVNPVCCSQKDINKHFSFYHIKRRGASSFLLRTSRHCIKNHYEYPGVRVSLVGVRSGRSDVGVVFN
jgi:hypothetical protein